MNLETMRVSMSNQDSKYNFDDKKDYRWLMYLGVVSAVGFIFYIAN